MNRLIPMLLLIVNAYPCFSAEPRPALADLLGSGTARAVASERQDDSPQYPAANDVSLSLRKEAMADLSKFIDERSPEEVGTALGLTHSRYRITDSYRIENSQVRLTVDLARQRLMVKSPAVNTEFKISSGMPGHRTPVGCYAPDTLETMHYSSLYNNAPMPHTVFFNGNIAVHATSPEFEEQLGAPVSHGCVRMSRVDAKVVFDLVRAKGKANTVICVKGAPPK